MSILFRRGAGGGPQGEGDHIFLLLNKQNNNWNKVINSLTKLYGINHYYNWFNRMYLFQEQKI